MKMNLKVTYHRTIVINDTRGKRTTSENSSHKQMNKVTKEPGKKNNPKNMGHIQNLKLLLQVFSIYESERLFF